MHSFLLIVLSMSNLFCTPLQFSGALRVIVVCLSVCLSVADLEDGGLLAFQRDHTHSFTNGKVSSANHYCLAMCMSLSAMSGETHSEALFTAVSKV